MLLYLGKLTGKGDSHLSYYLCTKIVFQALMILFVKQEQTNKQTCHGKVSDWFQILINKS